MMRAGAPVLAVLLGISLIPDVAQASTPRSWADRTREAFEAGKTDGVSVTGDGEIVLGPDIRILQKGDATRIWAVAVDGSGRVLAATGGGGKLLRYDPAAGEVVEILDADESEVLAVAADGDVVYAATGPDGKVYRLAPDAAPEVYFDPPDPYIWDLAVDERGRLFVATGDQGVLYVVEPGGEGSVLYDSPETHIRCLTLDSDGHLLAGSVGQGYVYRFSGSALPFVVFSPPESEVSALAAAPQGGMIVAAIGDLQTAARSPGPARPGAPGVTHVTVTAQADDGPREEPPARPANPMPARPAAASSSVYEVQRDGFSRRLFNSKSLQVLAVVRTEGGEILAGAGSPGTLLALHPEGPAGRLAEIQAGQVTALAGSPAGSVFGGTSNAGRVITIAPGAAREGTYTSAVKDAGRLADWGRVRWSAVADEGATVEISVRTGNTAVPDSTWSEWSASYRDADDSPIDRPSARWLQYRATLRPGREAAGPVLRSVQVFYLERNQAPEVEEVELTAPGVVMFSMPNQQPPDQQEVARAEAAANGNAGTAVQRVPTRKTFREGMRTVLWKARDANEDDLLFDVDFRLASATAWKPLARDLEDEFVAFDTRQLPDGTYRLRVVARDLPSNPPERALRSEEVGDPFEIDNTPPAIEGMRAKRLEGQTEIRLIVRDASSAIEELRYSVDAGPWTQALPEDGVPDSPAESFRILVSGLAPGDHSMVVQARDAGGNIGAGRIVFSIK